MKSLTLRTWVWAAVAVIVILFAWSWWRESTTTLTGEQGEARGKTIAAIQYARITDTVYVAAKKDAEASRKPVRGLRDTLLVHLTDTVLVRQFIAQVDTLIAKDSVALARADSSIEAHKRVTASVQDELRLAMDRLRPKRFAASASALYDPVNATPLASLDGSFRLIGRLSLVARGDMRFEPGGKPTLGLGASLAF